MSPLTRGLLLPSVGWWLALSSLDFSIELQTRLATVSQTLHQECDSHMPRTSSLFPTCHFLFYIFVSSPSPPPIPLCPLGFFVLIRLLSSLPVDFFFLKETILWFMYWFNCISGVYLNYAFTFTISILLFSFYLALFLLFWCGTLFSWHPLIILFYFFLWHHFIVINI